MANWLALPGPGSRYNAAEAKAAGFFSGLWHGLLVVATFVVSIFTRRVRIYESKNRGRRYDLGFLIGLGLLFGNTSVWIGGYRLF